MKKEHVVPQVTEPPEYPHPAETESDEFLQEQIKIKKEKISALATTISNLQQLKAATTSFEADKKKLERELGQLEHKIAQSQQLELIP